MKRVLFCLKALVCNILTCLLNIFIWRDRKIWLIGGWFGETFTDNSRFLFQYIYEHKKEYGIKRIVWFTRNKKVLEQMQKMGYQDVICGNGWRSFFIHLKSGVHVICNSVGDVNRVGDINTFLSFGAKKLQLWHGVSIKACGFLRREKKGFRLFLSKDIINKFFKPGMWGHCYQLATSEENKRTTVADFGVKPKKVVLARYPRDCECPLLTENEKAVINQLITIRKSNKVVLYLPTFRDDSSFFVPPSEIPGFASFLRENQIVWIQKTHMADSNVSFEDNNVNVISLKPDFDINVLYKYVDLLITDYSSAATDIMIQKKNIINYCPDFEYYENRDRGFVNSFEKYSIGNVVTDPGSLLKAILWSLNDANYYSKRYSETKVFLSGDREWSLDDIVLKIKETMRL